MTTAFRPRTLVLFVGDLLAFVLALWLSLFLRVFEAPSPMLFVPHLVPFSLLFVAWVAVFFIAGLYESRLLALARRALSTTLLAAQTFNLIIAALFFFFVPLFGIAPKTLLFIYLAVSFLLVLLWRAGIFPSLGMQKPEPVAVLGTGPELVEVLDALGAAHRPPITIVPAAPGVPAVSLASLYEEMFGRVLLSSVDDRWLADNLPRYTRTLYDPLKRAIDILIALPAGVISLIVYPFVALAIKLEDGGAVFIWQGRVGEGGRIVYMPKFRSMERNDTDLASLSHGTNRVTVVGRILRATRVDELPQLWSVVRGDLSLIGPRPELPSGVALYEKEIPYYGLRHLIKPGLSGWAYLNQYNDPHHGVAMEETRTKLSYDLYYLKHRSLVLDLTIALKTIAKLLTRRGV